MTIGIYALYWEEPDLLYIGQSTNIENRLKRHNSECRASKHVNLGIQETFNLYGEPLTYIVEKCSIDKLEELERYYINEFDSKNKGLNITHGSGSASGILHGSCIYSKNQLLKVFSLLIKSDLTYSKIGSKTKVHKSVVSGISSGKAHFWLKEEYHEKYSIMRSRVRCQKGKGVGKTFTFISPNKEVYEDLTVAEFVENNLNLFGNRSHRLICDGFYKLTTGVRKSYLGWKLI